MSEDASSKLLIVGCDASVNNFGLHIYDFSKKKTLYISNFGSKDSSKHDGTRFNELSDWVVENIQHQLLKDNYSRIEVCFEDYAMRGIGRICMLSELHGHVKSAIISELDSLYTLSIYGIPPASLKKFITCDGRASKDEMRHHCNQRYNQKLKQPDQVDAYCVSMIPVALNSKVITTKSKDSLKSKIRPYWGNCD